MPPRYDDTDRVLSLSVRDLVEAGPPSGHLVLEVAQTRRARMAAGRAAHEQWQGERAAEDDAYRAEVTLKHTLEIEGWTVLLHGRVDGLTELEGRTIVEEVKSTTLPLDRMAGTTAADWPAWTAQLELYLWMLHRSQWPEPTGQLVLVSLSDGSRHVTPVALDVERLERFVHDRLARLVRLRERRLAWHARRRTYRVPSPFPQWRPGQETVADGVRRHLAEGRRLLLQAPTGMGKTAAVLHGALAHAMAHDRQVFWATSRTTQQPGVLATLRRFVDRGLPLSWVALRAKEKVCLNDVVACRPDTCRFAANYHDKVSEHRVLDTALDGGDLTPERAMSLGEQHEICPFQLTLEATEHVDVVVGDVNYAVSPQGRLARLFGQGTAGDWVLVADEAHQLVERVREHLSPTVEARPAEDAALALTGDDEVAFGELADDIAALVRDVVTATPGPWRDELAEAELAVGPWTALASQIDAVALDHALLRARRPGPADDDPWLPVARQVLRFADALQGVGAETVALARRSPSAEAVRLLCLDPSPILKPWFEELGGFVGCSATLTPHAFHRDLLGLPEDTGRIEVPGPFPPEHRRVLVAPRVSTRFKDRRRDAPATAALLDGVVRATPGNTAIYAPSFSMLEDLLGRLTVDRPILVQRPGMSEDARAALIRELADAPTPVVLGAVLGGIFAEGVDLPPGALATLCVVGPALPPVGLERDLLRAHYDTRFGDGFRYASLIPGMTRVVQAAGRVVRRVEDKGVVVLVGRRFRWRDHAELLPADWTVDVPADPIAAVADFWAEAAC